MELRNSLWNKLCASVDLTTTKMNAHFVPQFFICLQAANTQNTGLQLRSAGWPACLFHREIFPFLLFEA